MVSLLQTLWRSLLRRQPKLVCAASVWGEGVDELRRRAGGWQEAGAFLLGRDVEGLRRIEQFLFYDDVDPNCFKNGIVEFNGALLGVVWKICRERGLGVVADVHVHPGHHGQSPSDQENPIMPEVGHLALILPHYASRGRMPGQIGVYEYLGSRRWRDRSREGFGFFHVGWWP
jgi:hypothetical protein